MNYSQFFDMIPEAVLTAILVIVFIADFASSGKDVRKWFNPLAGLLLLGELVVCLMPLESVSLFGGMYVTSPAVNVMKAILSGGTLLVVIMARQWIGREEGRAREGEFYMLVVSTLLGMFVMMSSGHFLLFFLGLEMASVPMACLVALDKYRNNSAEAAAKYILTATFSSGVMLFGVSYLYGATGTLYFADVAGALSVSALSILGLVFFFSGLAFKISLVPFHFWTADTYQGAPTVVTGYLSVVSKGAAAFTLMAILMKVFGAMVEEWHLLLYIVIVLSITVGNLFAMRQRELKRFMAFSSISQAGYIMLAVAGDSQASVTALSFYVLVYVAANLSVFAIINVVEQNNHGLTDMDSYNGFYRTNPKLAFLMTLALFSLAGIPPFAGMFSKFFVFMAAAESMSKVAYAVVFVALINTVISLYYYLLIVKAMYIKDAEAPLPAFRSDCNTRLALAVCTLGVLAFGVCSCIYQWIYAAPL
ncbi:MAG: NADH-quinone oxidoreductase subunit N [Prevotellaceae bacterium]|nr:NADH-quinone oxidoreductase subunit N [Prevotella sp.]MDD7529702.1 NADH-quinone oxidoreductase subunit N [Prevotellaceae bacterium]MDY2633868.1 NADH-quinone oxidoreductase subunit N [Prevotella sp.]